MPLTIRLATSADVSILTELIALSARGLSPGYYTAAQTESAIKYVFGVDTQLIADATYFVVEDEEQIIACGGWSKRNTSLAAISSRQKPTLCLIQKKMPPGYVHFSSIQGMQGEVLARCC